jgi:hypothetical protein
VVPTLRKEGSDSMTHTCKQCQGPLVQLKPGPVAMLWCQPCTVAHDMNGMLLLMDTEKLKTSFDPLKATRAHIKTPPGVKGLMQNTLEAAYMEGLLQSYMAGVKDGLLLAYQTEK